MNYFKKNYRLPHVLIVLLLLLALFISGCDDDGNSNNITSFKFSADLNDQLSNTVSGTISGSTISATMPYGTDTQNLIASFSITGKTIAVNGTIQSNGVTANDFSSTVTYTVTADDGSKKDYNVIVTINPIPSSGKDITVFSINGTEATINGEDIDLTLASGTDPTALVATFTTTGTTVAVNETIQVNGVTANDFSDIVTYTVTADDGSQKEYNVIVTINPIPSSKKDITAFYINDIKATINGDDIDLTLASETDPTALAATFTTTGKTVAVNGTLQSSGVTINDFSDTVTYTVTADDGSQKDYNVTVIIGSSPSSYIIADHTIMHKVWNDQIPVSAIENAKSNLHIAYGHTSHGSQITSGMGALDNFKGNTGLYDWNNGGTNGALDLHDYFVSGDLGHKGSTAWADSTRTYLNTPANNDVNVVMWSWCGGVSDNTEEGINIYLNTMNDLESEYPDVKFVYMTGHVDGSGLSGNLHRGNEQIRQYCRSNNKILYDFADIESYDLDGNYFGDKNVYDTCNYTGGNWATEWQDTHTQNVDWYSCGSAHSQPLNANQKAYAAWWLWSRLAGWVDYVQADMEELQIDYGGYESSRSVTLDIGLPPTGSYGSVVTWESDNPGTIDVNGIVTRPDYGIGDVVVKLTATITNGSSSDTKDFFLTVKQALSQDEEAVQADKTALDIIYAEGDFDSVVTKDVGLNTNGPNGTTITWESDMPECIATDGTVTRAPDYNIIVMLTATIEKGSAVDTKEFWLQVWANDWPIPI